VAYPGLHPRVRQSGGQPAKHGPITKADAAHARSMLVEAGTCLRAECIQVSWWKRPPTAPAGRPWKSYGAFYQGGRLWASGADHTDVVGVENVPSEPVMESRCACLPGRSRVRGAGYAGRTPTCGW
jgi:transposase IS116/IS110/IS902 family protein